MNVPRRTASHLLVAPLLLGALLAGCEAGGEGTTFEDDAGDGHSHDHVHADAGAPFFVQDSGVPDGSVEPGFEWELPRGFPVPRVPEANPMSDAKVELGRHLFYDTRLSANQTQSCGSCHQQALGFTDGRATGLGSTGDPHVRSSMALANVAYAATLTWANPALVELERQALVPLFGEDPVELGLVGMEEELLSRLRREPRYARLFADAYPDAEEPIAMQGVTRAIAAFERVLISGHSRVDRYEAGERDALDASELRGRELFFGEDAECFHCHGGFNYGDSVTHVGKVFDEITFHNTGLYNLGGTGAYPDDNQGLIDATGIESDMGRFKAPSLRNIVVTAPYMHDGSVATLQEVIEHYAAGGRTLDDGPHAGVGRDNPFKSEFVNGFDFSAQQKADLLAFLKALTDEEFLSDPRFADPWPP